MKGHALQLTKNYFSSYSGLNHLAWQGLILSLLESIFIGIYYFLPLYFVKEFHYSLTAAGFIITFYGCGTILGGFLGGKFSDYFSAKFVALFSLVCQAFIFLLLMGSSNEVVLSLIVFLMGLFSYTFVTSINLWVLEQCQNNSNHKLKAINLLTVTANVGLAISAIIMGLYIESNFHIILCTGAAVLFSMAVYFAFLPPSENKAHQAEVEHITTGNPSKSHYRNIHFVFILISILLMGFIIFQTNTTYAVYLQAIFPEYGLKSLSFLFTLNCLMVVFLQAQFVGWFGRFNHFFVMGIGALLIGVGMMILNYSYIFLIAAVSCVIYTLGEMLFCSISQLLSYEMARDNKKGSTMGLYRACYAVSRVSAPAVGTQIYQLFGATILWYLCGLLGALCCLVCIWLRK